MPNPDPARDAVPSAEEPESILRPRVLGVDDDPGTRKVLCRALQSVPYEVDAVATGEEGLRCLGSQVYDLALFDLNLPGLSRQSAGAGRGGGVPAIAAGGDPVARGARCPKKSRGVLHQRIAVRYAAVADDNERFYNRQRRHSTLGYLSPVIYELRHAA